MSLIMMALSCQHNSFLTCHSCQPGLARPTLWWWHHLRPSHCPRGGPAPAKQGSAAVPPLSCKAWQCLWPLCSKHSRAAC